MRSWQVQGGPRGRASPLRGGWQAGTSPLGMAAARAPDGEPPHNVPAVPGSRRADHRAAHRSPAGPPGLCFREPDTSRHLASDPPRAPLRPRIVLEGQGPGGERQSGPGGSLGEAGASGRGVRAARTGGGEEASPAWADGAPERRVGPALRESCSPPPAAADAGRSRAPRPTGSACGAPTVPRKFPQSAPAEVPRRRGAGPRHSGGRTKELGGHGGLRDALPEINKPWGPRGESDAGCRSGGTAPTR